VRIKLDIFHAKKRLTDTVKKTHGGYKYFCELCLMHSLSRRQKTGRERARVTQLIHKQNKKKNMTLAKAAECACKAMKRFQAKYTASCRRILVFTDPERLEKRIRQVIELFAHVKDANTDEAFLSKKTWKAYKSLIGHVRIGCISDHPDFNYYSYNKSGKLMCASRGTSSLEDITVT
jgi:hypothetical protein